MDIKAELPTLPSLPAVAAGVDREGLLAGLAFLETVTPTSREDSLPQWLGSVAERFAWSALPASVGEPFAGALLLGSSAAATGIPRLLVAVREVVVKTLRAFLAADDRFLQAAIFAGRVRRDTSASSWVARPREADALSDIVLSLFAADILAHREFHDQALCVCEVCGRVSFNPRITTRAGCIEHIAGTEAPATAVRRSSIPDSLPPPILWATR